MSGTPTSGPHIHSRCLYWSLSFHDDDDDDDEDRGEEEERPSVSRREEKEEKRASRESLQTQREEVRE